MIVYVSLNRAHYCTGVMILSGMPRPSLHSALLVGSDEVESHRLACHV